MKIFNFFRKFFNIYLAIVVALLFFIAPFIGYTFQRNYALANMLHVVLAIILCALIILFIRRLRAKNSKILKAIDCNFSTIIWIGIAILLVLQIIVDFGGCFIVGWDTRNVLFPDLQINSDYMSMYPNQIFLAGLFRRINEICTSIGITDFNDYYRVMIVINTLLVTSCVAMIAYISRKLMGNLGSICAFLCAAVFLGLNPYIMVPYSDTWAMFCVTSVLWFYVVCKKTWVKWPLMVLITVIGVGIKPTTIFVLLSVIFVEICKWCSRRFCKKTRRIKVRAIANTALCAVLICVAAFAANKVNEAVCDYGVEINEEASFTPTHFLMMGINEETRGAWNGKDVTFSRSFDNVEERESANIEEWKQRIVRLGPIQLAWIFINKTMTNFGDGSFAWEAEMPWNIENIGDNKVVWAIYGIDPWYLHNDMNNYFSYPLQCIWMGILIGCVLTWFGKRPRGEELVMCCSVLCIGAFLMLFEPDPRYLYLYTPCMIILGTWGWKRAATAVQPDKKLIQLCKFITHKK